MVMLNRTLEEMKRITAADPSLRRIPLATQIYADVRTPVEVLRILKGVSHHVYLLESAEAAEK